MTESPVEETIGWWLLSEAATAWSDAPKDPDNLRRMLKVAHEACVDYGPYVRGVDPETGARVWVDWTPELTPDGVPERFREAQLLQAKAQWAFERTGGGDYIGPDGTQVRTYPMGWQVKNLLRPDDGEPVIG